MPAADIGEALDGGKIVSLDDGVRRDRSGVGHRPLKSLTLLGTLGQHLPDRLAICLGHPIAAAAQTVGDVLVGSGLRTPRRTSSPCIERARGAGLEQIADRRQREVALRSLLENAEAREHAHDPVERGRVGSRLGGNRLDRLRLAAHVIGDAEAEPRRTTNR